MPQHRYTCESCGRERVELVLRADESPPNCCGATMGRAMPRRVVGRCMPDSNGVHAGSGFAAAPAPELLGDRLAPAAGTGELAPRVVDTAGGELELTGNPEEPGMLPQNRWVSAPHDPDDKTAIPEPAETGVFAKDYAACDAEQRDARWRDTTEALTAWHAGLLEGQGEAPAAARATASETSQRTVERARAEGSREDGLT